MAVINNPLSGERIVIRQTADQSGGAVLVWDLYLAPGGRVPSAHIHPSQEERFCVLDGRMRFRIGRHRTTVGPGDTIVVAAGTVHHFANAGPTTARLAVETRPALDMEAMLVASAALAQDQQARRRAWPRPVDLAQFMDEFRDEVRSPHLSWLVGPLAEQVARLARAHRLDSHYRRLRDGRGRPAAA
jgi:quercetin dioxygenase-like cupin family protein